MFKELYTIIQSIVCKEDIQNQFYKNHYNNMCLSFETKKKKQKYLRELNLK